MSNNFWTNPTPDRAQRYYVVCKYVDGTFKVVRKPFRQQHCSLYVRQAWRSAETSAAGVRTDDISATRRLRTRSASAARRTSATSGSSYNRVRLRGCTLVGRQRRLSWRRSAWVRVPFLTGRVEVRTYVQSLGLQSAYAKDDAINRLRLPQDTDAMVSCRQMSLAMSAVNLNRWQLKEATLVCRSICSTSTVTGLTAVGDRQRGRYFASRSAPTMLKAGITIGMPKPATGDWSHQGEAKPPNDI